MHLIRVFRKPRRRSDIAWILVALCAMAVLVARAAQTGEWIPLAAGAVIGLATIAGGNLRDRHRRKRSGAVERPESRVEAAEPGRWS